MTINSDLQRLEPGNKILLFSVDGSAFGGPELYFHNHPIPYTEDELESADQLPMKSIWWQGQEYKPWTVKIEGLGVSSDGSAASPTLSVANLDGTISAMCLAYQNMAQARVTVHMTFAHYLDARNFPEGNPEANPTQEKIDVYYIDSKTHEDNTEIHFALSSPADLQGIRIPTRQIHSLCTWCMRGLYRKSPCNYTGDRYFDEDGNPTDDPSKDSCSGLLSTGCEPRFGKGNQLPHGGFPGSALLRR
ncbi:phage minor tail protein L [Xenorhabdus bovienii]|uniref:Phage minor tail protein L n=1 Tax=Xenorhabdus bovienii TaxID=40576 RepID=A0AAJ1JBM4_XENBV|nr:phage minor tail protein L [Xenorhabdus bovienii]MDE1480411.1 phage minor tail protein L [Xenorhabdus bovienii]MDE9512092.1 phage minor tail protein L [Xenorhabdus bovienii]MDE9523756.1 phage minor tail protein L [Xenorhabdus bovienii]MDE9566484.1 phage minor tail protein L [Xenorhabdus bovienii]